MITAWAVQSGYGHAVAVSTVQLVAVGEGVVKVFGFLRKKEKPQSLMNQFIKAVYGDNPPKKSADAQRAGALAADELLGGAFDKEALIRKAAELNAGPIPYSTHDLAVSVALGVLKSIPPAQRPQLFEIQLLSRMTVNSWMREGKVVPVLAQSFEDTLYKAYKPTTP